MSRGTDGTANEHEGEEYVQFIDQPGLKQLSGQDAATLAEDSQNAQLAEFRGQRGQKAILRQL